MLDTFSQVMKVDGFTPPRMTAVEVVVVLAAEPFRRVADGMHRSALAFGSSYVTVTPGERAGVAAAVGVDDDRALSDPTTTSGRCWRWTWTGR
jgi:hypothetical protein